MKAVVAAIIEGGGFAWQLFNGGSGLCVPRPAAVLLRSTPLCTRLSARLQ